MRQGFEQRGCGAAVVPLGVVGQRGGGAEAGFVVLRQDERTEEHALGLVGGVEPAGADAGKAGGGGFLQLLAHDGGVDA